MKLNNKYLGIFSFIFLVCTIFILYDYHTNPLQEGLITTQNQLADYSSGGIKSPNTAVSGGIPGIITDQSQLTSNSTSNFIVTSSNDLTKTNSDITNSMEVISQGSPNCDQSTMYSMKNIMQDENGNVIIRYMDTCGKYSTYQYNQTINKIQNAVIPDQNQTQVSQTNPNSDTNSSTNTNGITLNVDASTIDEIVKLFNQQSNSNSNTNPNLVNTISNLLPQAQSNAYKNAPAIVQPK